MCENMGFGKGLEITMKNHTYKKGYLKVTHGHKLYYELYGNPKGIPVICLHGGPGAGFSESHKDIFDPKKHNVLLFDQRGSRRSKPFASLKYNTTKYLVQDIKAFYELLGWENANIVGGSWGTTLALIFAIHYPKLVNELILRSTWLGDKPSLKRYISGAPKDFYPEAWERLLSIVPKQHHKRAIPYHFDKILKAPPKESRKYSFSLCCYGLTAAMFHPTPKKLDAMLEYACYESMGPITSYYMTNGYFVSGNFIMDNVSRLEDIPIKMIHGKYDAICPLKPIYELSKKLKKAKLSVYLGGHMGESKGFRNRLVKCVSEIIQ
ncbi:MAG: alpha/beta fold hydrolase [bacterium]